MGEGTFSGKTGMRKGSRAKSVMNSGGAVHWAGVQILRGPVQDW